MRGDEPAILAWQVTIRRLKISSVWRTLKSERRGNMTQEKGHRSAQPRSRQPRKPGDWEKFKDYPDPKGLDEAGTRGCLNIGKEAIKEARLRYEERQKKGQK